MCDMGDGGEDLTTDEPSKLASTFLSTAPHYPNLLLLCIKSAQTTWLRKATPIYILSVKTVKEALTSRQWQPPRTMAMAPAGILFEEIAPNSSSPAFRASQIRRVFTATKLPLSSPQHFANCGTESSYLALLSWARTKRKVMPVTADTVNKLTSPAATATLRASRTFLLSAPWLRPSGLLFSPGGTDVQGRFWCLHHQIWSGGGRPRFPRPGVSTSTYSGLRLCKPDFFCSSPGALGFPPVLRIANCWRVGFPCAVSPPWCFPLRLCGGWAPSGSLSRVAASFHGITRCAFWRQCIRRLNQAWSHAQQGAQQHSSRRSGRLCPTTW